MNSSNISLHESSEELFLPSPAARVFWCVAITVELVLIVIANVLTILTLTLNRHLRKRSMYLVINLSVADLFTGAVCLPIWLNDLGELFSLWGEKSRDSLEIVVFKKRQYMLYLDHGVISTAVLSATASILSLVVISLERLHATVWPWRHRYVALPIYITTIAGTWLLALLLVGISDYNMHITYIVGASWLCVALTTICASYLTIFIKVKYHRPQNLHSELQKTTQRERELAKTLLIVTVTSLLAYAPVVITFALFVAGRKGLVSFDASLAVLYVAAMNALVNPLLYVFRMQEFRKALVFLVCKGTTIGAHVYTNNEQAGIQN